MSARISQASTDILHGKHNLRVSYLGQKLNPSPLHIRPGDVVKQRKNDARPLLGCLASFLKPLGMVLEAF